MPLVLTHGWPWTFWDFAKVIEPLAHPERFGGDPADAFDVIVPSLPGSIFSSPVPAGIGWRETAGIWVQLMRELGYERFGAHGGDSGAYVSAQLAHEFADDLTGVHVNFPALISADLALMTRDDFAPDEVDLFDARSTSPHNLTHYLTQICEPQTLAWAMQDSPVGSPRGCCSGAGPGATAGVTSRPGSPRTSSSPPSRSTGSPTRSGSVRFYQYSFAQPGAVARPHAHARSTVRDGGVPRELLHVPRSWVEREANLVHWTRFDRGGHFAAAEEPELVVDDLRRVLPAVPRVSLIERLARARRPRDRGLPR